MIRSLKHFGVPGYKLKLIGQKQAAECNIFLRKFQVSSEYPHISEKMRRDSMFSIGFTFSAFYSLLDLSDKLRVIIRGHTKH